MAASIGKGAERREELSGGRAPLVKREHYCGDSTDFREGGHVPV
jgi:hypothetical protein